MHWKFEDYINQSVCQWMTNKLFSILDIDSFKVTLFNNVLATARFSVGLLKSSTDFERSNLLVTTYSINDLRARQRKTLIYRKIAATAQISLLCKH